MCLSNWLRKLFHRDTTKIRIEALQEQRLRVSRENQEAAASLKDATRESNRVVSAIISCAKPLKPAG